MATTEELKEDTAMELSHKTKIIQFLGRTTPIVLQNDNGPCPLLAICNVLLLKNNLKLSADVAEVSQEKLLSLVAERLIDSNSNVDDKDAGYVENQQQNIADAIDLLPRLTTGIDVNIKFTRIDDFEFTRECAIFDLLDIPLYHGWIVDPQDRDTANAIGSKSYNTLMGELVALETINMDNEQKKSTEEDSIDFVAATTATLGVPSPSLSRGMSFEESPKAIFDNDTARKGDMEEEAELLKAMKMSEANPLSLVNESPSATSNEHTEPKPASKEHFDGCSEKFDLPTSSLSTNYKAVTQSANEATTLQATPTEVILNTKEANDLGKSVSQECAENVKPSSVVETSVAALVPSVNVPSESSELHPASPRESHSRDSTGGSVNVVKPPTFVPDIHEPEPTTHDCDATVLSSLAKTGADSDSSSGRRQEGDVPEGFNSSADSEPIYEGEECIMESETKIDEVREPMYEGEVVLAKQADTGIVDSGETSLKDQFSPEQGELIKNFLKNSASQLTISGLFCLQDGLKEREICVFFRNNHFNTMFKFEGELYLLATDQGYLNQPDIVWEKLNEVNGDTVFMNSNFKEFNAETHDNSSWNERNVMASTTDYIASIDNSPGSDASFNSDLQLAIALQQQEFEQQQQQQQRNVQPPPTPPPVAASSRLVTGPQVPRQSGRNSAVSSRQEPKPSKDKCNIM